MLQKIQQTIKQSVIYTIPGITSQLVTIVLVPIYTRIFVPADYGIMSGVNLVLPIVTLLLMLGIDASVARYYVDNQNNDDKKLVASTGLIFVAGISFIIIITLILFFTKQISRIFLNNGTYFTYFALALAALPFGLCYKLAADILRFRFMVTRYVIINIAYTLISVGLTILFVVYLKMGITGIYLATLLVSVTFSMLAIYMVRTNYALMFSREKLKKLLRYSLPLVPSSLVIYLFQYADRYFLIHLTTLTEVGLYSIGVTIASAIGLLIGGFSIAWTPLVYSTFREKTSELFYRKIFDYFWAVILLGTLVLSLFSKLILNLLAPITYTGASTVVPFLILGIIFLNASDFFSFGIAITQKTQYRLPLTIIPTVINIGLNYLLIPPFGMIGAACATLISSVIYAISSFIVSQKLYHINYNLISLFKILAVTFIIMAVNYLLLSDINVRNIVIKIGLILVFLGSVYVFNLVGKDELKYLHRFLSKILKEHNGT